MDDLAARWPVDDLTYFPVGFFDIGGKTFAWVYENKKEFREYVLEIKKTTGLWKSFQDYVIMRLAHVKE
jgi:hypothetical protein